MTSPPTDGFSLGSRQPPHNLEAEQALLGALFLNARTYEKISEFLLPEHFADPVHGRIYEACVKLIERGQIANPVTLGTYFGQDGALAEIGGTQYLAQLANAVVSIINAESYARLIYDLHLRRELIAVGIDMINLAIEPTIDIPAPEQIGTTEERLYKLSMTSRSEGDLREFHDAITGSIRRAEEAHKRQGKLAGVSTGLIELDRILGGLHPSDLLILAGRPGMGKTSLATNIAFNAAFALREEVDVLGHKKAVDGAIVAFFSLEMSMDQLATRILAEQAAISSSKVRNGNLDSAEFERLAVAATELNRLPLYIDDTPALPVSSVRSRARRLQRKRGLGLVVVDYLQLLRAGSEKAENRTQEVSAITRGLKALAKELNVPVLALSQLSRAVETREDKTPQMSDLRESGSIEQDADVVMFVYREHYYLKHSEPAQRPDEKLDAFNDRYERWRTQLDASVGKAEVTIAKQRHGPTGKVNLHFEDEFTKFGNAQSDGDGGHHL